MDYLESISQHRIAPPAVTGRETGRRPDRPGLPELQRRPAPRGLPGLHPEDARARLHRRPDALRRPDPGRAGDELPDPADPGRVRRLDRLDRGEPLPRHPLRPRPAAAPEPAQPRRLRAPAERRHPDLRHRLRLQDPARHRRLLPRADPGRGLRPADGDGRVPPRGRPLPPRPGRRARAGRPTACSPRPIEAGVPGLHVEPRRQLDRHEPRRPRACRAASSRSTPSATSTRRPRSSTTPSGTAASRAS